MEALGPLFELFYFRRAQKFRQKKLQNLDSIQSEGGPKGLHADIGSLQDLIKTAQNLKRVNI
jgi:hypothetical protein